MISVQPLKCTRKSPFFLAINYNAWRTKSTWYKASPLGKNQIGQFLPKAAKNAGLQACGRKLSNHSVRKTSISRLLDAGISENFVTQLNGHKNFQSLRVLSIMPKIPEISVGIQMVRSVSASSDRNIRDHLWRGSTYFGWNIPIEIRRSIFGKPVLCPN